MLAQKNYAGAQNRSLLLVVSYDGFVTALWEQSEFYSAFVSYEIIMVSKLVFLGISYQGLPLLKRPQKGHKWV